MTSTQAAPQPDPFFPAIAVPFAVADTEDDGPLALHVSPGGYTALRG